MSAKSAAPPELACEVSRLYFELFLRRTGWVQSTVAEFSLSPFQARTLVRMDTTRPSTMSEVAQAAACEPSNLTGIVDKLEARGLVKRSLAQGDRRVKLLSITRAGLALRAKLMDRIRAPAPWMLALSQKDQKQLAAILQKGLAFEAAQKPEDTEG